MEGKVPYTVPASLTWGEITC